MSGVVATELARTCTARQTAEIVSAFSGVIRTPASVGSPIRSARNAACESGTAGFSMLRRSIVARMPISRPPDRQVEERSAYDDERCRDVDHGEPRADEHDAAVGVKIDQRLWVPPPTLFHLTRGRRVLHRSHRGSEFRYVSTPGRLP